MLKCWHQVFPQCNQKGEKHVRKMRSKTKINHFFSWGIFDLYKDNWLVETCQFCSQAKMSLWKFPGVVVWVIACWVTFLGVNFYTSNLFVKSDGLAVIHWVLGTSPSEYLTFCLCNLRAHSSMDFFSLLILLLLQSSCISLYCVCYSWVLWLMADLWMECVPCIPRLGKSDESVDDPTA